MAAWWQSLTALEHILLYIAVPATLVLIIQTVLLFAGGVFDSDGAGEGGHDTVDPEEYGHQAAEIRGRGQLGDVDLHGLLHRGEHLPVHVVQQRDDPQQAHDDPGINAILSFQGFHKLLFSRFSGF